MFAPSVDRKQMMHKIVRTPSSLCYRAACGIPETEGPVFQLDVSSLTPFFLLAAFVGADFFPSNEIPSEA